MSKVGGTVLHVLHSLEPRPPSSSRHAIQNTWSVLAGSANNGLDEGEGGRRGEWKAREYTQREREREIESRVTSLNYAYHESCTHHSPAHRLTIRGKCREGCDAIRGERKGISDNCI